jgi:hypothetical protein
VRKKQQKGHNFWLKTEKKESTSFDNKKPAIFFTNIIEQKEEN